MSRSKPCFVANWKMHKTIDESDAFIRDLDQLLLESGDIHSRVIIAPPFTAMASIAPSLKWCKTEIGLSAQNVHFEEKGAYTGEISTGMLRDFGCAYVIIGHSERRNLFGESNEEVHQKLQAVRQAGMRPILCIGESLEERQSGLTWSILEKQLSIALGEGDSDDNLCENISEWMIAYEPVWAIGSGLTPTPDEVAGIHQQIQEFIASRFGNNLPPVLYGGSVSEKNIADFMKEVSIGGVLVGGASLAAESFHKIISLGMGAVKSRQSF